MDQNGKYMRDLSEAVFGPPTMSIKVELNQNIDTLYRLVNEDRDDITTITDLVGVHPFLERLCNEPITQPPDPPVLREGILDITVSNFLRDCRVYRKRFPTYDKATKLNQRCPTASSTYVKFELGIDTAGSYHLGAGRTYASSVPKAAVNVDWMQGSDAFSIDIPDNTLVVSDLAIPDEEGLGVGRYPALVCKLREWYAAEVPVIVKLNIFDYDQLVNDNIPIKIAYKPRKHNLEVICMLNIPTVELDTSDLIKEIVRENIRRNDCIYQQHLPFCRAESIHIELLSDDRDYASVVEGLSFEGLTAFVDDKMPRITPAPEELEQQLNIGMETWTDSIDSLALMKVKRVITEHIAGKEFVPPPAIAQTYHAWPRKYKKTRAFHFKTGKYRGLDTRELYALLTVPLAILCAELHHYPVRKIAHTVHVYLMNLLAAIAITQRGTKMNLGRILRENAALPR